MRCAGEAARHHGSPSVPEETIGVIWTTGWPGILGVCREDARAAAEAGRHRGYGQSPAHKPAAVRAAIENRGAELRQLAPYSPDLNPIEMAFSKLKAHLKKAAARMIEGLWYAIAEALATLTTECPRIGDSSIVALSVGSRFT